MILLLSRQDDGSTREVAEWLCAMGKNFVRINSDDHKNRFIKCDLDRMEFTIMINENEYTCNPENIESVWNRRSGFSKETLIGQGIGLEQIFHKKSSFAKAHLGEEADELFEFLKYLLQENPQIKQIGNPFYNDVNKMIILRMAKSVGLNTPSSYIVTSKEDLAALLEREHALVTKALGNGVYRFTDEYGYYSYTEKITMDWLNDMPDRFFPSLVQRAIEKEYELRIFFLKGKFYSMAIFSTEFAGTSTDFRKTFAADAVPRSVPYQLPRDIERKLSGLMKKLKLNTGSIDMIVTPDDTYYFLEVNPVGQFGMVSKPCNYYLEKKIAETL